MDELLSIIKEESKNIANTVKKRINEFEEKRKNEKEIFKELCFCLLTANFNAEKAIKIQNEINDGFLNYDEKSLSKKLRELGYRYPNVRAKYIVEARKKFNEIMAIIKEKRNEREIREWLVKNIKGLGYKEASHFLRNIGYKNVAIIDFHILNILQKFNLITNKPKTLTRKTYHALQLPHSHHRRSFRE